MELPIKLIDSLRGLPGFDEVAFIKTHESGDPNTSIRINPAKETRLSDDTLKVPWSNFGYYLKERISFTLDPVFHAGGYYVQEASSMFLEQALKQSTDLTKPLKILDLSAAPGGKSTHIESLITGNSLLVSNEVIRSRANILQDNIIKWGCRNVVVTNNDPRDFGKLEGYFDVIVVDAPCSGSGLFRKNGEAVQEWSLNNVQLCSRRQQRILADAWPALRNGGTLIYSTCSYSKEEDESIIEWMGKEFQAESVPLEVKSEWNIFESSGGYRFWPDKLNGEGFFIAVLRKTTEGHQPVIKKRNIMTSLTGEEKKLVQSWLNTDRYDLVKRGFDVYAWPPSLRTDMEFILGNLHVIYSGVRIGELKRDKLVPDHALAMSGLVSAEIPRIELSNPEAIRYLRKESVDVATSQTGWHLVTDITGHPLGWINILPGRINNYYPKQLRILKER